ncbi:MAG: hypothetical protein IKA02_05670 [Clostridia bacterium]|nr:hypothetical protein [Clostridia bacterium]
MYSSIKYRTGDEKTLCDEFFELAKNKIFVKYERLEPYELDENKVLAIRFTSDGGQGDIGGVTILCYGDEGVKVLYGNYYYGNLNLSDVTEKLPIINIVYRPRSPFPPYPYGECNEIPKDWTHIYIGLGNYFFAKTEVFSKAESFIEKIANSGGGRFAIFDAFAFFCGAEVARRD